MVIRARQVLGAGQYAVHLYSHNWLHSSQTHHHPGGPPSLPLHYLSKQNKTEIHCHIVISLHIPQPGCEEVGVLVCSLCVVYDVHVSQQAGHHTAGGPGRASHSPASGASHARDDVDTTHTPSQREREREKPSEVRARTGGKSVDVGWRMERVTRYTTHTLNRARHSNTR